MSNKFVGAHTSAAGGVFNAPINAKKIGAQAFALFTKNQRQWVAKPLDTETIDRFKQELEDAGVAPDCVFKELFVSPEDHEPTAEDLARAAEADAGAAGCQKLVVTVDGNTHELPYAEGKTVLETARDAGVEPPFSCEDGYCSCCMAKLVEGQVKMRKNDCLTQRDLEQGWVLTCQSVPQTTTVEIDWDAS